jgi:hypothetical protein
MKSNQKSAITLAMGLLAASNAMTQAQVLDRKDLAPSVPSVMQPSVEGKGILLFSSRTQDTGEILDTEEHKLSFLFRNTGAGPLTITQTKVSCGCTVPELSKKTYMPGESGTLDVTFDPRGKKGAIARNITIFTDSDTTPSQTIIVRSLVKPVIVVEPMVIPFQPMQKGTTATEEFKVYGRTDDFKVTRATISEPEFFDIEVIDMGPTEYQGENMRLSVVKVTVKPNARPDNHRADVTIRTNDERKPVMTHSIVARVLGDLNTNPVRVTMGRMVVGDAFEREFNVTSKSGTPFKLESVALNTVALDSTVTYEPVNEEQTDWVVKITGTVKNAAPRFNTPIRIITNVSDEKELTLQMYGQLLNQ